MNKIKLLVPYVILAVCLMMAAVSRASAATFYFSPVEARIGTGGEVDVSVFLDPAGEHINAVEGEVLIPNNFVSVGAISDGDSIIGMWIQKPAYKDGKIIFSGIIPGGFDGTYEPLQPKRKAGKLFSFRVRADKAGDAFLVMRNVQALRNDGFGTPTEVSLLPLPFEILEYKGAQVEEDADTVPPEPFMPKVVRDKDIFGGKYFLAFQTQDKGHGISHYEISETKDVWVTADSPYVLKDQSLQSTIRIKAVDYAGNERTETITSKYSFAEEKGRFELLALLFLGALLVYVFRYIYMRRS